VRVVAFVGEEEGVGDGRGGEDGEGRRRVQVFYRGLWDGSALESRGAIAQECR
jgi:hypothetical protein